MRVAMGAIILFTSKLTSIDCLTYRKPELKGKLLQYQQEMTVTTAVLVSEKPIMPPRSL